MKKSMNLILILMLVVLTRVVHADGERRPYVTGTASGILDLGDTYEPFISDLKVKADLDASDQCSKFFMVFDATRVTPYGIERDPIPYSDFIIYTVSATYRCDHGDW